MNNLLVKASFIGILVLGISSCTNYHIRKGDNYFENLAYHDAIDQYEKVYPQKSIEEVELKLADAYFKTGKLDSSGQIYKRAIMPEH